MRHFVLIAAVGVFCIGCGDPNGNAAKPSGSKVVTVPAATEKEVVYQDPIAFDKLALASDSSYDSQPIPGGTQPGEVREFTKLNIKFCWCPPGTFTMGSPDTSPGHLMNERQFEVTLSKGFWMQQTELTQQQYEELMGTNPSFYNGPPNPVDSPTWNEATEFCRRLSELPPEKKAGNVFRLPTEAEWEYACRAGSTSAFCFGDDEEELGDYAWYHKNSARMTHPVGEKKPNAWGLHDMHGNVMEWCRDFFSDYPRSAVTDPTGPKSGDRHVLRGGSWFHVPLWARSSHREAYTPSTRYVGLGFRLLAAPAGKSP